MSILRQTSYSAAAAVVYAGGRFLSTAILARHFSQEVFGFYAYSQWLIDTAFLICSVGVTGVASRYFAEYRGDRRKSAALFHGWINYVVWVPIAMALAIIMGRYLSGIEFEIISVTCSIFWAIGSCFLMLSNSVLIGLQKFNKILYSNIFFGTFLVVIAYFVKQNNLSINYTMLLFGVACALASCIGWSDFRGIRGADVSIEIDSQEKINIKKFAINIWITSLLMSLVWSRGEMPIVKLLQGDIGVARYTMILTIFGGAAQAVMLGVSAAAPQLTRLIGEGREQEAVYLAKKIMSYQIMVCGVAATLLIVFGEDVLRFAFGNDYAGDFRSLGIMSLGLMSFAISNQNHLLQIKTNGLFTKNISIFGAILLIALSYVFVYWGGVQGAVFSRVFVMVVIGGITGYSCMKRWGRDSVAVGQFIVVLLVLIVGLLYGSLTIDIGYVEKFTAAFVMIFAIYLLKYKNNA